ncbi:hypothetical protein [Spiroplasma sp. AdecLV25b]|uniref:hypothetical protein n=1 Tax=Spiroplasma sp. AdecLV25b TaxID=3027162 RepID=UPI0027DFE7BF|nr:hypothetical protein [Spiroplasma sp. AdecLV25b]
MAINVVACGGGSGTKPAPPSPTQPTAKFTDLRKKFQDFKIVSETTGMALDMANKAIWFDSTKINDATKGLSDLGKQVSSFFSLSETTGILKEETTNQAWWVEYK